MIFGFALVAVGYAMFYWGLHHFCGADCPTTKPNSNEQLPGGGTNTNPCTCRYSLIDLLGLSHFGIAGGAPVQLNPGGNTSAAAGQKPPTQPQKPNNNTTPTPSKPKQKNITPTQPGLSDLCTICCDTQVSIFGFKVPICPGCKCP